MDKAMAETPKATPDTAKPASWRRYLPLAIIVIGLVAAYAAGVQDYISLAVLAEQRDALKQFVADHRIASALGYFVLYALAVAFAFPAASILTIFAGFVFGWFIAGTLTVFAATTGAAAIFLAARSAFGDVLRKRAGPFAARLADGFSRGRVQLSPGVAPRPRVSVLCHQHCPGIFRHQAAHLRGRNLPRHHPGHLRLHLAGPGARQRHRCRRRARDLDCGPRDAGDHHRVSGLAIVAAIPTIVRKFRQRRLTPDGLTSPPAFTSNGRQPMSTALTPDICIIGGGSGGLSVAAAAAAFGVDVVLVEKGKMGGDCLNYGCVPSKAMIAAGKHAHAIAEAPEFGVTAGEAKVNFRKVHDHIHSVIGAIAPNDSVERFRAMGVNVIEAEARFVDKTTLMAGQTEIRARRYVVATGSSALVPPIPGLIRSST
jgi:uncharacterized membrane protein YdjX (TVP38/TMEM64 family)